MLTVWVGICTYGFGDTGHRQQYRLEREALVGFNLHLSPAGTWSGREAAAVSVRQADARPGLVESMIWMG